MGRRIVLSVATLLVTAGLAASCGGGDEESEPAALAVKATSAGQGRFALEAPESVEAGLVRLQFTNGTDEQADVQLLRLDDGHTLEDALGIVSDDEEAPIPDWLHAEGGLGTTETGATVEIELVLEEGTYYLIDTFSQEGESTESHGEQGATATVEVTGGDDDAELPEVDASIEMNEYSFVTEGLKPGPNRFLLKNSGDELHHTLAFPITEGATLADVRGLFQEGSEGVPPPLDLEQGVGTAVLDGGREQITELEFQAGRYALLCLITDRAGGPPHVAKGMIREIEVS